MADEMVKVVVAYSPKLSEIGTIKEIPVGEFRALSRQGRVRRYNPDVDGPEPAPAPVPEAVTTATGPVPPPSGAGVKARPNGGEGDGV